MVWFERDEILDRVAKRIKGFQAGYRQNLAVLGPEGIGKTTLLKRLLDERFPSAETWLVLRLEVRQEDALAEWVWRFIRTFLYELLQGRGVTPLPTRVEELFRICEGFAPRTVAQASHFMALAEASHSEEVYDCIWDLPHTLAQETGALTLLVLEEFHRLGGLAVKDPFRRLGRKIMVHGSTMYLMSSSSPSMARAILKEGLALLFGQFEVLEVPVLSASACRQAIRVVGASSLSVQTERLLMNLAQGVPAHLDLLLQGWKDLKPDVELPEGQRLIALLESLFFEPGGMLRRRFEMRLRTLPQHRSRLGWIQVLGILAEGVHQVDFIAQRLHRPATQVTRALQVLEQAGMAVKEGVFYRIPDHLFALWMLAAYPILQGVGLIDPVQAASRFREAAEAWVSRMHEAMTLSMEEQVRMLLERWGGERVKVEGRAVVLPRFRQVELFSRRSGCAWWFARPSERGKNWLVIPWTGALDELQAREEMGDLTSDAQVRMARKLLLGVHPVHVHARLILQQARIRVWDLAVLNQLLELYGLAAMSAPDAESATFEEPTQLLSGETRGQSEMGTTYLPPAWSAGRDDRQPPSAIDSVA